MPGTQKFAIDKDGPKRLTVRWKGIWKNVEVMLDDQPLGEPFPNLAALKQGRDFATPDGRTINVRFQQGFTNPGLQVTIDGRPLPGSGGDPRTAMKTATGVLWFVAGVNLLLGALGLVIKGGFFEANGIGLPDLVFGAVFAGLAIWWMKSRSRVAIMIALVLMVVAAVLSIMASQGVSRSPIPPGMFVRVFIIIALFQAFRAVKAAQELEKQELVEKFR